MKSGWTEYLENIFNDVKEDGTKTIGVPGKSSLNNNNSCLFQKVRKGSKM